MEDYNDKELERIQILVNAEKKRNRFFYGLWNSLADGVGVSTELIGIGYALAPGFSKGSTTEEYMTHLASGAFAYLVGHGIRMHQMGRKTYDKLDNIEKLLIEQNKKIKGE